VCLPGTRLELTVDHDTASVGVRVWHPVEGPWFREVLMPEGGLPGALLAEFYGLCAGCAFELLP